MIDCKDIVNNYIQYLSDGFSCYTDGRYTVIETPHLYSDGDTIELYLDLLDNQIKISDFGETSRRLELYKFNWNTKRARSLFSHIINSNGVSSSRGALSVTVNVNENVGEKVSDLIQAIQQTDNLIFTVQKYAAQAFRDDVEGFLRKEGFEPELNYQIDGESGMQWRVHFFMNHNSNILLKALSASSKGSAKYQVSTMYAAYDDIKKRHSHLVRSVILDDETPEIWDSELVHLAEAVIDVGIGYWSKREVFAEKLHEFSPKLF